MLVTYEYDKGNEIIPEAELAKEGYTFSGWTGEPITMPNRDVTVNGTFTANKYTLAYEVECDAQIPESYLPTKEGYTLTASSEIPETMPAHDVMITGSFTFVDGIAGVSMDGKTDGIYTLDGRKIEKLQKGVNIIRTSDGNVKKVFVK